MKTKNEKISHFDMQFFTSSISITFVLLLLGLVVFFVLAAANLTVYVRENITLSILVNDDMKEADILKFQKDLEKRPFVKSSVYISKQQALEEQTAAMGTNPKDFLGYNPFKASLEIYLRSDYANMDSIAKIEKLIRKDTNTREVLYREELIDAINNNIRTISLILLGLALILTLISFVLINNTVRLAIYSKRFLIYTMTLVGADWGFIRKPFVAKCVRSGICAAAISGAILIGCAFTAIYYEPELIQVITLQVMIPVVGIIIISGILIPWWCGYFSVNKYLRMKSIDLYYI
ncbi:MAG: permease-like cell division protein FtsX [Mediterranea sp.]|jgi:cell division transport system permease protein|nr:permease-like cell division protein FtsX [Mediterranea sp.]